MPGRWVYSMKIKAFRTAFAWNRDRLIKLHGYTEGNRLLRELALKEAMRLWRAEGPGRLDIN